MVPIGAIPVNIFEQWLPYLEPHFDVLSYTYYFTHLAYLGSAGAHTIGWVGAVPLEEADDWLERGYPIDAQVGRMGIEAWGEEYLSGKPSANLNVRNPAKEIVTTLSSREAEPPSSIYTTLDANLQLWAQLALRDFTGAIVVLERDTGRVLAMASSPTFNPNYSDAYNPDSGVWATYFDGTYDQPFLNRATQGQYPPGSIFKVITLAAALETDIFNPYLTFDCQHYWYGPDGYQFEDWTVEKDKPPSGVLNMMEGLMRSCNPWFYQMGYTLYENGYTTAVADMAREFGLGSVTGIEVVPEEPGNITNPEDNPSAEPWFNAVQQAIGQSDTVITPIQAAAYIASIGNGGTLYRPQLIERIENAAGEVIFEFEPIVNNTLPISENTLLAIQEGLKLVTNNARGTAYHTFSVGYLDASHIIGKTGTAQNPGELPHAWFIGYTTFENPYRPDIAIAVLVENIGDGSEFAAPIFRRLLDTYIFGEPQSSYPWESSMYVFNPDYFLPDEETEGAE
jgi:penicillin-binding protein 2